MTIPAAADARGCVLYAMNNHGQVLAMKELPVSKYLNTTSEDRLKALHHQVLSNDSLGQLPDSIRLSGQLYGSSADDDYNYAILPEETLEFSVPQDAPSPSASPPTTPLHASHGTATTWPSPPTPSVWKKSNSPCTAGSLHKVLSTFCFHIL